MLYNVAYLLLSRYKRAIKTMEIAEEVWDIIQILHQVVAD